MDTSVRNFRQLRRGIEADVVIGISGVPSASVTMKVTLGHLDPEWKVLQEQLAELFVRRATEHVDEVVDYNRKVERRRQRAAKSAGAQDAKSA